jgi:hypothetical protein
MFKNEYIFISYKREDIKKANRIQHVLKSQNLHVWWDEELQTGQKWEEEIDRKLGGASAVIVLWSNLAVNSDWVKHEASYAKLNKKLVHAKISECNLPVPFQSEMAADLSNWGEHDNEPEFIELASKVKRVIRVKQLKRWYKFLVSILFSAIIIVAFYLTVKYKAPPPYPIDNGVIADFNGSEGTGALTSCGLPFSLMSDSSQNMESNIWYHRIHKELNQKGFVRIHYQLNPHSNREGYVGVYFDFTLPPAQPVSLEGYGGVRFKMRINQEVGNYPAIRIVLYSDNVKNYQYAYPIATVSPTGQWNTYNIPFGEFTIPPHAYNHVTLDKGRVFRFAFVIVGNEKVHGNIDVDDIMFFKS